MRFLASLIVLIAIVFAAVKYTQNSRQKDEAAKAAMIQSDRIRNEEQQRSAAERQKQHEENVRTQLEQLRSKAGR